MSSSYRFNCSFQAPGSVRRVLDAWFLGILRVPSETEAAITVGNESLRASHLPSVSQEGTTGLKANPSLVVLGKLQHDREGRARVWACPS